MDYATYSTLALRTAKFIDFENDLQHAVLGISSEVGEIASALKASLVYNKPLDPLHLKEEVGDLYWFINLATFTLELWFTTEDQWYWEREIDTPQENGFELLHDLAVQAADLCQRLSALSTIDPEWVQQDGIELDCVRLNVKLLIFEMRRFASCYGFTLAEAADANIRKLAARFPNGYSDQAWLTRDKEAEQAALRMS